MAWLEERVMRARRRATLLILVKNMVCKLLALRCTSYTQIVGCSLKEDQSTGGYWLR
jgi:hypothetical protein